mmetsp:Transcript_27430/g.31710  ORF Transcript_27430/g.31710 Transcript_27430/m.31710 type:complete len:276 (+) Transcript_27430:1604-2431(+)
MPCIGNNHNFKSIYYSSTLDQLTMILQMVLDGSVLCEKMGKLVNFTVVDEVQSEKALHTSVGRQLSSLCIRCAPVAQGAILYVTELASDSEFVASAAYSTLTPCLLSLARIIAKHQPSTRQQVLDLVFIFLRHSSTELSYQKTQALKEQCLRLLLWLTTLNQALSVFYGIAQRISKVGNSEMDSAHLRYFFSGFLDVIQTPVSVPLIRAISHMLLTKSCSEALLSSYFTHEKKKELSILIENFRSTLNANLDSGVVSKLDEMNVATLVSLYYVKK